MYDINIFFPKSGKVTKDDGTVVIEANGVNNDGNLVGSNVADVTLQEAVSAMGNGTIFTVGSTKTVTIEITGTSTS